MDSLILSLLAAGAYISSAGLLVLDVIRAQTRRLPLLLAWLATVLHGILLATPYWQGQGFSFGFVSIASLVAGLVSLLLLLACTHKPVDKLGIVLFPIAALMLLSNHYFPSTIQASEPYSPPLQVHILSSIIAFSLLNIAALQAILLAVHEKQLRNHPPKRFILRLPPLQTMEALLFQMIATGVVFLSVALCSGFIFIDDLFAQHLAHKTVLSILAWLLFSGLLLGRICYGWRGKTAIKWTLTGFLLLLLAYFGSKFVLELILHR